MGLQQPAVLGETALDLDRGVLAAEIDVVQPGDGGAHGHQNGVELGDDLGDGVGPRAEAVDEHRQSRLLGDGRDPRVQRQAESDDPLGRRVGVLLRVGHHVIEQFVDADEAPPRTCQ